MKQILKANLTEVSLVLDEFMTEAAREKGMKHPGGSHQDPSCPGPQTIKQEDVV